MNLPLATVNKLLTWSCVDGPGNRLVLFLQGCNFACPGCHNPYTIGQCNDCGLCVPACPTPALSMRGGRVHFDPATCTQCDACLTACPISASPMTRDYTLDEVLDSLRENAPFLTGITVSGGEATLQLKFILALFAAIKADPQLARLTCFIDSNGHLGEKGWQRALPVTDGVMLDVKAFGAGTHQALTGRGNDKSLASVRTVHAAGKLYELRFLLVPGKTDTPAELEALADLVLSLDPGQRVRLNAFQHHGVKGPARDWERMTRTATEAAAARLAALGLGNVVLPSVWL